MIWFIHYVLMTSGLSGVSVLLGVYLRLYTDASQTEIGALLMTFPFVSMFTKPIFCSMADRHQSHRLSVLIAVAVEMIGYAPFAIIPFFPAFYEAHPRIVWYILVVGCHLGNGGLHVAWSLGDCLAMNHSQKTGTPFGHMRLMGTLGWGVYGFIIGQINETPLLPKYIPAFIILHSSLVIEIALIALWDKDEFEMVDPLAQLTKQIDQPPESKFVNSIPSSLSGTLRLNHKASKVLRDALSPDELDRRLKNLERNGSIASGGGGGDHQAVIAAAAVAAAAAAATAAAHQVESGEAKKANGNPQMVLLKFMLMHDGRVIKYLFLLIIFGILVAPMNFIFLSMEEVCRDGSCNFSQLAGALLISQALIETFGFLVVPWCMNYLSRSFALTASLFVMSLRYFFYAGWFYTSGIDPYWSVVSEWCYGITFAFFISIQCDVALDVANQSRLFIPELRRMGFLSDPGKVSKEVVEAEETSIKMALRATMCSLFSGAQDGLGQGLGSLLCGVFIEMYSYIHVWHLIGGIAIGTIALHQLVELTRSRWSDTYRPKKGTKAYEIVEFNANIKANSSPAKKMVAH